MLLRPPSSSPPSPSSSPSTSPRSCCSSPAAARPRRRPGVLGQLRLHHRLPVHQRRVRPAAIHAVPGEPDVVRRQVHHHRRSEELRLVRSRLRGGARVLERRVPVGVRRRPHDRADGVRRRVRRSGQLRQVRQRLSLRRQLRGRRVRVPPRRVDCGDRVQRAWRAIRPTAARAAPRAAAPRRSARRARAWPACTAPFTLCGDACVDTTADPLNCGGCGKACTATQVCLPASCGCPGGTQRAAATCASLESDPPTAARAATRAAAASRARRQVRLPRQPGACASGCTDTDSDPSNCGACGAAVRRGAGVHLGRVPVPAGRDVLHRRLRRAHARSEQLRRVRQRLRLRQHLQPRHVRGRLRAARDGCNGGCSNTEERPRELRRVRRGMRGG